MRGRSIRSPVGASTERRWLEIVASRSTLRKVAPVRSYVVGVEPGPAGPCAHALIGIGDLTNPNGIALCGFPSQGLTIVPELSWEDVGPEGRCLQCAQQSMR
jgi:hypothetical protein